MDMKWWQRLANSWVKVRSVAEAEATSRAVTSLVSDALSKRQKETSMLEDILAGIDDDDD